MNTDRSLSVMSGLLKQSDIPSILNLLTPEKQCILSSLVTRDPSVSESRLILHPNEPVSDESLRKFLSEVNKKYFDLYKDSLDTMETLPPELSTMVFFSFGNESDWYTSCD